MHWAELAVGICGVLLVATALWPLRGRVGSGLSFLPSWLASEAPLHSLAVLAVAAGALAAAGGLRGWAGWLGLAMTACAGVGLAIELASGLRSHRHFESALAEAGLGGGAWPWTTEDTRRVALVMPIRPRRVERLRNVAYLEDGRKAHRLDLYRPAGTATTTSSPVLLYFHGGAWVMGDKREQGLPMLHHLAERGYICISANYALSPRASWPEHVLDCKRALVWVKRHVADYGGDPGTVFVAGGSAGGHLAALVALTTGDPAFQPGFEGEDTSVAGAISLYGVYDFVDPDRIGHPDLARILERRVFQQQRTAEAFAAASPISRVSAAAPPFLVIHGRNDVLVPLPSARAFVRELQAKSGNTVVYVELPLTQHAFDNFWSPRTVHLAHATEQFLAATTSARAADRDVGR